MKNYDGDFRRERSAALLAASVLILCFSLPGNVFADLQKKLDGHAAPENTRKLVEQVVNNEIKAEADDSTHWRFVRTDGKPDHRNTWDIIETPKGEVRRLIAVNGKPLSAQQQHDEQERMHKFLSSPDEQAKRKASLSRDYQKEQDLMRMLPKALLYTYAGQQGNMLRLNFKPNPRFQAQTREAEVFHHMAGVLVIDMKNKRLAEFRGHLISDVKFGWGILGYLDQGGTFDVKQQNVADTHWDLTLLETHITGKSLFFKNISVREKITEGKYQRVADNLTLHQAANMLQSSASRSASGIQSERGASAVGRDQ